MKFFVLLLCLPAMIFYPAVAQRAEMPMRIESSLLEETVLPEVYVLTFDSVAFLTWMRQQHPSAKIIHESKGLYRVAASARWTPSVIRQIPGVLAIDRAGRKPQEEIVLGDFDQSVNAVTGTSAIFPDINGSALTLSIKEKPFDIHDLDLRGRIVLNNQFDEPSTPHATFMATIAAGAGNTSRFAKGAAWGASVTTSDFERLLPDEDFQLKSLSISVQNHSYGVGLENYYGVESNAYDRQGVDLPKMLHVFSSGNRGTSAPAAGAYAGIAGFANLTGQFKVSKNTLSVGSSNRYGEVVPLSSRGPAHDGRVKPELIAFGDAGSSESAAIVSGIALQVQQKYMQIHGELPDAALVKAILINSAHDTGRPHVDYETGFGNADALHALRTVASGNYLTGSVNQDEELTFSLTLDEGTDQIKVTLVWADPPAVPFNDRALVNDLDLSLKHISTQEEWDPWVLNPSPSADALMQVAARGKERLNNVEQVTIDNPTPGNYQIKVKGYDLQAGSQKFHIAYQVIPADFEWRYPLYSDALRSGEKNIIRWQWHGETLTGELFYKTSDETGWRMISNNVPVKLNYYEWDVPDVDALIRLQLRVAGQDYESDWIAVTKPNRLKVGFDCDEQVMLVWNKTDQADRYEVYQLGEQYLERFAVVTDTILVVSKSELVSNYFSYAPMLGERAGYRDQTIDYTLQGTGCYFISVLPRESTTTSASVLDVLLGTTYMLASATLERQHGNAYDAILTKRPLQGVSFSLSDAYPLSGTNVYRVKLETFSGEVIYSADEKITYVGREDFFLYPNPLTANESVAIVLPDAGEARIQLLDYLGRVLREAVEEGLVKTINTEGLISGTYLIRVQQSNGKTRTGKLVVLK